MYKLCFYIPETHVEQVKQALFDKGAGKIGLYDHCSWQVLGIGQFRPLEGSDPFLGTQHNIETVAEYKVEMVCEDGVVADVVKELIHTHPYQEPAYEIYQIISAEGLFKKQS
ncbi:MAG: NGG1p interacting factor NIF3 [Methylococcaceae bacterium]